MNKEDEKKKKKKKRRNFSEANYENVESSVK